MIEADSIGLLILFLIIGLAAAAAAMERRLALGLRRLPAFEALKKAIGESVESARRVHISMGTGGLTGADAGPGLAGLALLAQVAAATALSDKPTFATTADGAMMILAQDGIRAAQARLGYRHTPSPQAGRMVGATPFSYAAGLPMTLKTEEVSSHILLGSFRAEGALAADFGRKQGAFVLAGTEDIEAQALLYATAEQPLIGEEVYAGSAYLGGRAVDRASLRAQDAMRVLIVLAILAGIFLKTFGFLP